MEITLTITPGANLTHEVMRRINEKAGQKGVSPDDFVANLLTEAAYSTPEGRKLEAHQAGTKQKNHER